MCVVILKSNNLLKTQNIPTRIDNTIEINERTNIVVSNCGWQKLKKIFVSIKLSYPNDIKPTDNVNKRLLKNENCSRVLSCHLTYLS